MFYDVYCQLCRSRGLTPSGAASRIGFNRASVTQWKNSGNPPKQELLLKIASFFNVFLFLGAWSATKLPQMLFEISQLGARFAAARFALNLAVIALIALLMDKTAGARERAEILRRAEEMSGKR